VELFWQHHKTLLLASDFAGCQGALNAFTYTFGEDLPLFYAILPGNSVFTAIMVSVSHCIYWPTTLRTTMQSII